MSAYNTVTDVPATCPQGQAKVSVGVQFKFGSTWQYRYILGDALHWGSNDIGTPGHERVVADGAADSSCPACGYEGDWDFYVFIERDRIVRVTQADGTHDFVRAGRSYLDLGSDPGSVPRR